MIAGMGGMAGKAVAIFDRSMLLIIVLVGMGGGVAVLTELHRRLFQGERITVVGAVMAEVALTLFHWIMDNVSQQMVCR